jgi:hypothetical protein
VKVRKRFLAPEVLEETARIVYEIAQGERVPIALIGGYAMQLYGSDRLTGDIDIAAAERLKRLPRGKALSFGGQQTTVNGVPVDLVVRKDDYAALYEEAIEKARAVTGVFYPVAQPEHLAAMKMAAGRSRDLSDLEFLIASKTLDVLKATKVIHKHLGVYAAGEFTRLVEEVRWKASRGRV